MDRRPPRRRLRGCSLVIIEALRLLRARLFATTANAWLVSGPSPLLRRALACACIAAAIAGCGAAPRAAAIVDVAPAPASDAFGCDAIGSEPDAATTAESIALVCVRGVGGALRARVESDLATRAGGKLDEATIAADVRALYATGGFRAIDVTAARTPRGLVVKFTIEERERVAKIELRGARALTAEEIADLAGARGVLPFDPAKIKAGALAIEEEYRSRGYADVKADIFARETRADGDVVSVTIEEGPKVVVGAVRIEGADKVVAAQAMKDLVLRPGAPFWAVPLERDTLVINAVFYDHGYVACEVDPPRVTRSIDRKSMEIVHPTRPGPQYRIARIGFAGADDEAAYRAMLDVRSGDVFSRKRIIDAMDRMQERADPSRQLIDINPDMHVDPKTRTVDLTIRFSKMR